MGKVGSILGKVLIFILILAILAPWLVSDVFHIRKVFHGPQGKIYILNDGIYHNVITFEDDAHLCIYNYQDSSLFEVPSISGIKVSCRYSGYEPFGIGPIHFSDMPSILIWKNYYTYDKGENARAMINLELEKVMSINATPEINKYELSREPISISFFDDYIVLDGNKFTLITDENDATDYVLRWFDKYGKETTP